MSNNVVEEVLIINKEPSTVYSNIISWLNSINANILMKENYSYIVADHEIRLNYNEVSESSGKIFHGPKINWSKRFQISIYPEKELTFIRIIVNPPYKSEKWHDYSDRKKIWLKYVGDLAKYLGISLSERDLKKYYNIDYYKDQYKYNMNMFITGFLMTGFLIMAYFNYESIRSNIIILLLLFISLYMFLVEGCKVINSYLKYAKLKH